MSFGPTGQYRGSVLFLAAVGCATATIGEDPGAEDPNAVPATGGSLGTGGSPATSSGGSGRASSGGSGTPVAFGGGAGMPATGGRLGGGASAGGGAITGAAGSSSSVACADPRMPAMAGNSGSFDTLEAVCYFVEAGFNHWACSNPGGRTVTINGAPAECGGPLPAAVDGGYYFQFGASSDGTNYTSFYWYTS